MQPLLKADDMDQETGDIVTVRQAKLAEILEGVNKDFSEAGAMLFELKNQVDPDQETKVLPAKTKVCRGSDHLHAPQARSQQIETGEAKLVGCQTQRRRTIAMTI